MSDGTSKTSEGEPKFHSPIFEKIFKERGLTAKDVMTPAERPDAEKVQAFLKDLDKQDEDTGIDAINVGTFQKRAAASKNQGGAEHVKVGITKAALRQVQDDPDRR